MFHYQSTVQQPTPNSFSEAGKITIPKTKSSFAFNSTTDGMIHNNFNIAFGSIAYHVTGLTGQFSSSFGMMIDIFESFPNSTTFPIYIVGFFLGPAN